MNVIIQNSKSVINLPLSGIATPTSYRTRSVGHYNTPINKLLSTINTYLLYLDKSTFNYYVMLEINKHFC